MASAPGKVILFGEHAVVFGEPALAMAIERRTKVEVQKGDRPMLNGRPFTREEYPYLFDSLQRALGSPDCSVSVRSTLPLGGGLGSSASLAVACIASAWGPPVRPEKTAREGYEVELAVQGRASPIDTSTCTLGQGVLFQREKGAGFVWEIERGGVRWNVHRMGLPECYFVIGMSGIPSPTGPMVAGVKARVEGNGEARDAIVRIGEIVREGLKALQQKDLEKVGGLMRENQSLLDTLGVGHPALTQMIEAVSSCSYGAKLTGAGGGGSMIALVDDPKEALGKIKALGFEGFFARPATEGVQFVD